MKTQFKSIAVVVLASCFFFGAHAQINLLSPFITFRSYDNAARGTTHYGDLTLSGGSTGASWGWLSSQAVNCYGWMNVYGSLNVYGTKNFGSPDKFVGETVMWKGPYWGSAPDPEIFQA